MWRETRNESNREPENREPKRRGGARSALRKLLAAALAVLVLAAVGLGGFLYGKSQGPAGLGAADQKSLKLYAEALAVVRNDYVGRKSVDPKKETYGAIEGMLNSLGDTGHTRFLTPKELKSNEQDLSGRYVGVGIQIEERNGRVVVAAPLEGSPAQKAGIRSGDVLVGVNGANVAGQDLAKVSDEVRGPAGSEVKIKIRRGGKVLSFNLKRQEITSPAVYWSRIPNTDAADVRLSSFSNTSADELLKAFRSARSAGAKRFVLDLRDNPGGDLDQAVKISSFFLKPGSVVYIRQDASGDRRKVRASGGGELQNVPLVVLVNGGSASSAEILSGALRDNNRAKVVGETTFGTGTVLQEFDLSDGSAILLGIAEWLTPNGDFIRKTGIVPDVKVSLNKGDRPLTPSDLKGISQKQAFSEDPQLKRAFEELGK